MHGYRWLVHLKCLDRGLVLDQETVRELLHIIDPEGIKYIKREESEDGYSLIKVQTQSGISTDMINFQDME